MASGRFLKPPHRAYCGLVFFVSLISAISGACAESTATIADRSYIGTEVCSRCHVLEAEHWNNTIHAKVFKHSPRSDLQSKGCEACHGPGSAHIADVLDPDAIIGFTRGAKTDVRAQNKICSTCHEGGPLFHWLGSTHEVQDLSCGDCHNPMSKMSPNALLRESSVNETCFVCHGEQRLQFRKRSHMPLLEGKMTCVDCHNPHGSTTDPLLKADSTNQLCYTCHAEKRGPFLWDHAPVTENCLTCHEAHGSNRKALLNDSPPFLCQQCHVQIAIFDHATPLLSRGNLADGSHPDERLLNRGCVNCHSKIHGSNHPSGARFHR